MRDIDCAQRLLSLFTSAECAEAIAGGVEREARTVMTPRAGWVLVALERIMPWAIDKQLAALNRNA
jgi:hypothetical protein